MHFQYSFRNECLNSWSCSGSDCRIGHLVLALVLGKEGVPGLISRDSLRSKGEYLCPVYHRLHPVWSVIFHRIGAVSDMVVNVDVSLLFESSQMSYPVVPASPKFA